MIKEPRQNPAPDAATGIGVRLMAMPQGDEVLGNIDPASFELLDQAASTWIPEFELRAASGIHDEDRVLWSNGSLQYNCPGRKALLGNVLIAAGAVQGIVLFDPTFRPSKMTNQVSVLYIDYLATAPWNRTAGNHLGQYRHVGESLVRHAVRESIRLGSPGRVGMHCSASAASFFQKLSFADLGIDSAEAGLNYFELRPAIAFNML